MKGVIDTPALITILAIIAFFVAIFTIRIRVNIEMQDELKLWVIAFGVKINVLPKKPKKYKIGNYTPEKIAKRDRAAAAKAAKKAEAAKQKKKAKAAKKKQKQAADARLTKADKKAIKAKKKASLPPIPDMLDLFMRILKLFFSGLFMKFHFHVARIRIEVGSEDAAKTAMTTVALRTAMRPILRFIDKHSNRHGMKNADILISPNSLSEEIKADVKMGFSVSIGGLLGVIFKAGFAFIFGWMKIKPTVPADVAAAARAAEAKRNPPSTNKNGSKKAKESNQKADPPKNAEKEPALPSPDETTVSNSSQEEK